VRTAQPPLAAGRAIASSESGTSIKESQGRNKEKRKRKKEKREREEKGKKRTGIIVDDRPRGP
jgi:hypothetical protein